MDPKEPIQLQQGLITALACWLATVLAFLLHLDNPWWATISAWVVANPDRHALLEKAGNRIIGTLAGCLFGYWLAMQCEGKALLQLVAMFIIAALGVYGRFRSPRSYAWIIGSVGGLAIFSMSLETPGEIYHFTVFRTAEVICGVVASTFVEIILRRQQPRQTQTSQTVNIPAPMMEKTLALRLALIAGISIVLVPILWSRLYLPSLPQIVISSLVVLDRDAASTHFRGLQRILGCLVGGLLGVCAAGLEPSSFLVWSATLIGGVFIFAILHHSRSRWSYVGTQGGVALILALVTGGGPPDSIVPAVGRIAGMLCGVGILIGVCAVLGLPGDKPLNPLAEANSQ